MPAIVATTILTQKPYRLLYLGQGYKVHLLRQDSHQGQTYDSHTLLLLEMLYTLDLLPFLWKDRDTLHQ